MTGTFLPPRSAVTALRPWLQAWMVVALLSAAMAGAVAANRLHAPETTVEFGAEMIIEFAPFVASVGSAPQPEASEVNQEDQQAMPELEQVKSQRVEQDIPTEQASPEAPEEPDLQMAKERTQEEVEEAPALEQATEASRPQEQQVASQASTSVASAPEQEGEPPKEAVTAPEHGNSRDAARRIEAWQRAIFAHIGRYKVYPDEARRKRLHGEIMVYFVLDRAGAVSDVRVEKGSGERLLDQSAVDVLKRASPLPKPPADVGGQQVELLLPIRYQLR